MTWFLEELDPAQPTAFVRRYALDGDPLSDPSPAGHQPAGQEIAASPDGGFVSIWETSTGRTSSVVVRQLGPDGISLGPLVVLGHATFTNPTSPPVASNGAGSFVAIWPTEARGGIDLYARRFRL
ncbi:MAG TPA: hypothetical protein VF173_06530 [Thermoanaerobaculia bacterium]|nr:hypothetical protein [Thermoanaerobaculia bacterium]